MATLAEILTCSDRWDAARGKEATAAALADESLAQCRTAVLLLQDRLRDLGYPVSSFINPIEPDVLDSCVDQLERHTRRPVPKILVRFWSVLGGVSFLDLEQYSHETFWIDRGVVGRHGFCDGFHVDACNEEWVEYVLQDFDDLEHDDELELFQYTLAPDGYHKADISGGGPYGVAGNEPWFPAWRGFWWAGHKTPQSAAGFNIMEDTSGLFEGRRVPKELDFLSYIRTTLLECGGFPGLYGSPEYEPIRKSLVVDLPAF